MKAALDLVARAEHRPVSSLIEKWISERLATTMLEQGAREPIGAIFRKCWSPDQKVFVGRLARYGLDGYFTDAQLELLDEALKDEAEFDEKMAEAMKGD